MAHKSQDRHSTKDLRDSNAQHKYRQNSQSQYKDEKEAAHKVSLAIADKITEDYRGPGRPPANERENLKELLNDNLRMVDKHTNRSEHTKIDNSLMKKAETGDPLTQREEERARQQVKVFQNNPDKLEKSTYGAAKKFL